MADNRISPSEASEENPKAPSKPALEIWVFQEQEIGEPILPPAAAAPVPEVSLPVAETANLAPVDPSSMANVATDAPETDALALAAPGQDDLNLSTSAFDLADFDLAETELNLAQIEPYPSSTGDGQSSSAESSPGISRAFDRWTAILNAGTTGLGLAAASPLGNNFNLRLGINSLPVTLTFGADYDNIAYQLSTNVLTASALVDYYPFGPNSIFYISGGLAYQNNRITGNAQASGTVSIGGNEYNLENLGGLSADIYFSNPFAPYLGIGIGAPVAAVKNRLSFFANAGVMYVGEISADLRAGNPGVAGIIETLQNDLDVEVGRIKREVAGDFPLGPFYPVVLMGVTYTF
jgi:hypothetical protein